jgi:hypothetical protein
MRRPFERPSVRGWYRNPSRTAVDSLGIAYRDDDTGNWRSMHPDFVFFHEVAGKIVASILDPHGHHIDDGLMKLKALAMFAGTYGHPFVPRGPRGSVSFVGSHPACGVSGPGSRQRRRVRCQTRSGSTT